MGLGVVGDAVAHGLTRIGHEVVGSDPRRNDTPLSDVLRAELVFVCVPTPARPDGSCDASAVEGVVASAAVRSFGGVLAIKSTVEPGTTDRLSAEHPDLRLAFVPEFLRERAAHTDFVENHDVCVVGTRSDSDFALIRDAHGCLPRHVARLLPVEAELAKYFSNLLNALRVVFANEFYEVATALGADYGAIKAAMVRRSTIGDAYLDCNAGFRGFGGVCLPKDARAFAHLVRRLGLSDLRMFDAIVEENDKFVATVPAGMRAS